MRVCKQPLPDEPSDEPSDEQNKKVLNKNKNNNPLNPPGGKEKFNPLSVPIPEWLNSQAWSDWVSNRNEMKKPIKTERGVNAAFKLLKECLDDGHDPADVINNSIANGYQGLFKPKYPPKRNLPQVTGQHWNDREAWENEFI